MKKISLIVVCLALCACTPKKPPLEPTQIVNGKSIVIPPEFDVVPEQTTTSEKEK